jgi:hypothetical protein
MPSGWMLVHHVWSSSGSSSGSDSSVYVTAVQHLPGSFPPGAALGSSPSSSSSSGLSSFMVRASVLSLSAKSGQRSIVPEHSHLSCPPSSELAFPRFNSSIATTLPVSSHLAVSDIEVSGDLVDGSISMYQLAAMIAKGRDGSRAYPPTGHTILPPGTGSPDVVSPLALQ